MRMGKEERRRERENDTMKYKMHVSRVSCFVLCRAELLLLLFQVSIFHVSFFAELKGWRLSVFVVTNMFIRF